MVRRSLGRRLKALRNEAGKTASDVATAGIASKAKLARIESGVGAVKMADVRALCWLYGADQQTTDSLADLALNTTGEGWWEAFDIPPWFSLFVELESAASEALVYDGSLVCGLLQTQAYQRAIFEADVEPTSIERQIALRTQRQKAAFERDTPLRLSFLMCEGVLTREVGGPAVMAEQREHLLHMAKSTHCESLVIPWAAGAHASLQSPYVILRFDGDPDVLYLEHGGGARYVETPATVDRYIDRFMAARNVAISIEEYLSR